MRWVNRACAVQFAKNVISEMCFSGYLKYWLLKPKCGQQREVQSFSVVKRKLKRQLFVKQLYACSGPPPQCTVGWFNCQEGTSAIFCLQPDHLLICNCRRSNLVGCNLRLVRTCSMSCQLKRVPSNLSPARKTWLGWKRDSLRRRSQLWWKCTFHCYNLFVFIIKLM